MPENKQLKLKEKHYKFFSWGKNCINCGICMDVCPVNALDFKRPVGPGAEGTNFGKEPEPKKWMHTFPSQVGKCIGCQICEKECPVQVITIMETKKEPKYEKIQGPVLEKKEIKGFIPLSSLTRVNKVSVPKTKDPWGKLTHWVSIRKIRELKDPHGVRERIMKRFGGKPIKKPI